MKALVVGATGYTGGHVVRQLRERGIETVAHVRPDSRGLTATRKRFEALGARVDTSPWEANAIAEAVARSSPDLVFCLLGTTRRRAARERIQGDIYEAVEGRLTRMVVDAVRTRAPAARLVFLSSVGANPSSRNAYVRSRAEIERYCLESGLAVTIARAPFISGRGRAEPRRFEQSFGRAFDAALRLGSVFGARGLAQRYGSLSVEALARALILAALDAKGSGVVLEPEQLREQSATGA